MADTPAILAELGDRAMPDTVRASIEAGDVGALIGDSSRILAANDAYLALTGFSRQEMESGELSWLRLTPPEWLAADARGIGQARAQGRSELYEKEYSRRDGSRLRIVIALVVLELEPLRVFAATAEAADEAGRACVQALASTDTS
jgi:hypothetical protein